jgi:hypothetical protein
MDKIKTLFLDSHGKRILFSMFAGSENTKSCILFFLPLFEERMWSQRIVFNFAKLCAEQGISVIMWDYYGYGESDGDSEDFTIQACSEDVKTILEYLKSEYEIVDVGFLGIRSGCGIACNILEKGFVKASNLVLWAPVLDLKGFIFNALRSTISTQSHLFRKVIANRDIILNELLEQGKCSREKYILNHIDGYRIGKTFYKEILSSDETDLSLLKDLPILYLDVLPPTKEVMLEEIKYSQNKKMAGINNINYEIVIDGEFWINRMNYSQSAASAYEKILNWYNQITFNV